MSGWLAILVGLLAASATLLLLRRDLARVGIGIILLGHAANLMVFAMTGAERSEAPLVAEGETLPPEQVSDPLPMALVLTAIVIGFALQAFALVLFSRVPAAGAKGESP